MKALKLCGFISMMLLAFLVGHYTSERNTFKNKVFSLSTGIAVTEQLLNEHLKRCNKTGYKRFMPFHQHNLDRVYRMSNYATGFPYFFGESFSVEVADRFDSHKVNLDNYKLEFERSCTAT
ncbi:MAG: hypothetical protein ABJH06_04730 [Paraglaciecola sp.]|uniref:hypothetical protein n=1 Tax=Paraglaciecola sp. TaxID=1920173 RepID=UPI003296A74C